MLLATEQSETIEKANLLIVNSCQRGFYGKIVINIKDGIIEQISHERSIKKPFETESLGKNVAELQIPDV